MEKLCVSCLEKTPVELESFFATDEVNGETVEYEAKKYICQVCGEVVPNNELSNENFDSMYRQYRKMKHLLMPEEIKFIREDLYSLSTRYFAKLIGCSPATVSRIENGALQSRQHDNQYRLVSDPRNMKLLFDSICEDLEEDVSKNEINNRLNDLIYSIQLVDRLKGESTKVEFPTLEVSESQTDFVLSENVASYFIAKNKTMNQDDAFVTPLKLQKLMYYAQGWYSAFTENFMLKEDFQAWIHGPVIPEVYSKYKGYGSRMIDCENVCTSSDFTKNQLAVLDWVWEKYGRFTGRQLEKLTHNEIPWKEARGDLQYDESSDDVVTKEAINNYFSLLFEKIELIQKLR